MRDITETVIAVVWVSVAYLIPMTAIAFGVLGVAGLAGCAVLSVYTVVTMCKPG